MPVTLYKVFLALRTDFIPNLRTEHITLDYYKEIGWDDLTKRAKELDSMLPATIVLKEAKEWESFEGGAYTGYGVASPDSHILDHLNMPHITVPQHSMDKTTKRDVEIIDRLWMGKKIDGRLHWMRIGTNQIGV